MLNITQLANASALDVMNATGMDFLGKVVFYDAKDGVLDMQGKWTVNVHYKNETMKPYKKQAEYVDNMERKE